MVKRVSTGVICGSGKFVWLGKQDQFGTEPTVKANQRSQTDFESDVAGLTRGAKTAAAKSAMAGVSGARIRAFVQ